MNIKLKKALLWSLKTACVIGFWLAVWAILSLRIGNDFLFPDPKTTFVSLLTLFIEKDFWIITLSTLIRVMMGIIISLIVGTILAIATENSKLLKSLFSPLLTMIKSTPVASFIILALIWIERSTIPAFIISLIVIPIVWSNISQGIRTVDKGLKEVAQIYRFSLLKKILKLYIPTVLPFFMAACRASLGMAWKAGISAEILSTPDKAIGTELYFAKTYLETPLLFAWTVVIIVLSLIIEKLFVYALTRLSKRLRSVSDGGTENV